MIVQYEPIRAYVTKYALTKGVLEIDGEVCCDIDDEMFVWTSESGYSMSAHGKDWHRTLDEAIKRAEEMRANKIASLKKSIVKLEEMNFKCTG